MHYHYPTGPSTESRLNLPRVTLFDSDLFRDFLGSQLKATKEKTNDYQDNDSAANTDHEQRLS
jgi:hypothetical protein